MAPDLMIGRRGEIADLAFKMREGISLALAGPRRVGKTTLGDAVCAELRGEMIVLPRVEVAEHRTDASDLLNAIVAACQQTTLSDETGRIARALRPAFEALLASLGLPIDVRGLFIEPGTLSQRQVLLLPVAVAEADGRPVVLFLDELQRVHQFGDLGLQFLADLIDLYTDHREVVLLVDGSDERLLEELFARAQLDKLLDRHDIAPRILTGEWRLALPDRFAKVGLRVTGSALEQLIAFGAERPYETMWICQRAALSAVQSGTGQLTYFDVDQAVAAAVREL